MAADTAIRIDAGSAVSYRDVAGRVWEADRAFVGGATTANASRTGPSLTGDPQLFKTMRYGKDFAYAIPVGRSGIYLVRLLTSELNFPEPGKREFTVAAEGRPVAADLDLAKAPGQRNPWTLEVPVTVADGTLDLRFTAALDYAQISAIEVIRQGESDPYRLVWADEFDGTAVDPARWNIRNDTWQDNELSINTSRRQNVFVSDGNLTIRSLRETRTVGNTIRNYTSGYLDTNSKHNWTYGRFEFRAKLATQTNTSKGIWPAFWMRPTAGNGEIDIMEAIGSGNGGSEWNKTHHTIHHDYMRQQPAQGITTTFPSGTHPSDGFHIYAVEWEAGSITWFIDGRQVWRRDRTTTAWFDEVFAKPYNLRLNQQIGGTWAGTPDSATSFPADFVIDWVRVWQKP